MKKFASAATAILLVALMAMSCMVTVFAATAVDTSQKGSISMLYFQLTVSLTLTARPIP